MEKKSKINIAQNTSSGAEKVEAIASENTEYSEAQTQPEKQVQQRKSKKVIKSKNGEKQSVQVKTKKEKAAAEARVQRAIKKKEEKENKKRLKAQKREEKRKKKEEMAKKRAEEKRIKEQKRIEEREARQREHARKKANAKRARQKQKERREQENKKRRSATAGNGGWIAAVVTLGVTTLALTTAVTVGAIEMMDSKQGMLSGYKSTTYELAGIMEHVNDDLDRARVANTPVQQSRILTDLLVQARLAEADLEKLPISPEEDSNVTSFLNRVAAESSRMLAKLQRGEKLSERDEQVLEKLYEINRGVKERLSSFTESMDDDFNSAKFVADLFVVFAEAQKSKDLNKLASIIYGIDKIKDVLGVFRGQPSDFVASVKQKYVQLLQVDEQYILEQIEKRAQAKQQKDYALADQIRNQLDEKGIMLKDSSAGTDWDIKQLY